MFTSPTISSSSHIQLPNLDVAEANRKEDFSRVVRRIKYTNSGQFAAFDRAAYSVDLPPAPKVHSNRDWARYKDLAETAVENGNYSQAEAMWLSALYEANQFGSGDARLALTLENLANLYLALGRSEQAEMFMRRAVDVNTVIYGPMHLRVAHCLNNLGGILYNQRRFKEAEPMCIKQLHIYESVYGINHGEVGMASNNLAMLYHAMGKYDQAERMYQRALQIRARALGSNHASVGTLRRNYYNLLQAMNKGAEAEELLASANALPKYDLRDLPHPV